MLTYFASKLKLNYFRSLFFTETRLCRYFSSETTESEYNYKPSFTTDEERHILQKLNDADSQQLYRYSIPKNTIKKLYDWKKKNGIFNTLIDILDVDGMGIKTLDKLCKNILQGENENSAVEIKEKSTKGRGQFLTPVLSYSRAKELTSSLGVHLFATGISWARIERCNNNISNWDVYEFNLGPKKLSPIDALQLVIDVFKKIPNSDVYIFEVPISVSPNAQQSPVSITAYVQRIQLLSMLITLLSTSPKHNPNYTQPTDENTEAVNEHFNISYQPNVFFLRNRLSARLFKTLVGTEKVSTETRVSNILLNNHSEKIVYTPITINENLHSMYNKQIPVRKEVLGQALLLNMTFMDVCVSQNPDSLKTVSSNR